MNRCTSLGGMRASVSEYRYSCLARGATVSHACHTCRPLPRLDHMLRSAVLSGQGYRLQLRIDRAGRSAHLLAWVPCHLQA